MEQYFADVVESLTIEDTYVLGVLQHNDAITKQKSIKHQVVMEEAKLSQSIYRKTVDRLVALKFIVPVKDYKDHTLYISPYGLNALSRIVESMER